MINYLNRVGLLWLIPMNEGKKVMVNSLADLSQNI